MVRVKYGNGTGYLNRGPYLPDHMNKVKEISRSLKGKVSSHERYFRVLITNLIVRGRGKILFDEQEFCNEMKLIEGEGEVYDFLIRRRNEFIRDIDHLILDELMRT
jgi:hypothetical protein